MLRFEIEKTHLEKGERHRSSRAIAALVSHQLQDQKPPPAPHWVPLLLLGGGHCLPESPLPTTSPRCPAHTQHSSAAFIGPSRVVIFFLFRGGAGEEETPFLVCSSPLSFTRLLSACSQWRVRAWEQQALGSVIDGQTGRRGSRTRTPPRSAPHRGAPAPHCRWGLRLLVLACRCVGVSGAAVSWVGV